MPMQLSPHALLASLPSFMSVFGESSEMKERKEEGAAATREPSRTETIANNKSFDSELSPPAPQHRDSTSTINSDSTDSSPTTTISTLDSSSMTEPSPGSSPESAISITPLSSFKSSRSTGHSPEKGGMDSTPGSLLNLPGLTRPESPGRKVRNMKNLSLDTSASNKQGPQLPKLAISTASAVESSHPLSAPTSPSFILPPKPPKRKPSRLGLTISTPGLGGANTSESVVPPTPAIMRPSTLRHFQSYPSLSVFSPTLAPEGGMQLPPFGNQYASRRLAQMRPSLVTTRTSSYESSNSSPLAAQPLGGVREEDDYELPLSQEVKSPAYPEGPVCIYDPHIYLYLEPNEKEASSFDVVLNVAREVQNPFTTAEKALELQEKGTTPEVVSEVHAPKPDDQNIPEPQTAVSDESFRPAFETIPTNALTASPTTPKALKPGVEYIHMPWDHNTNIVDDMLKLCELIDDRVRQGKRILIHCQCGVSRSASLVVAYGLYKNPEMSVQDAYDTVKKRSRWIGPNMNLIYQLSEFRNKLPRASTPAPPGWRSWRTLGKGRSNTGGMITSTTRPALSPTMSEDSSTEPHSAPLPAAKDSGADAAQLLSPVQSPVTTSTSFSGEITPGPSSAPPDMQWSPTGPSLDDRVENDEMGNTELDSTELGSSSKSDETRIDCMSFSSRGIETPSSNGAGREMASPLSADPTFPAGFSGLRLTQPALGALPLRREPSSLVANISSRQIEFKVDEIASLIPPTPSLMSPRAAEFTASPFHRTAAGDLAAPGYDAGPTSPKVLDDDPRSPAQRGEFPIARSIFDVL
ncbi:hypothetical protein MMC16_004257 [Acarospora aff. strigata]|nr:hypothetical protein [Acarospora aff. strigata]